jgi:acetylglutamate kinase
MVSLIKIGGNQLDDPTFVAGLAGAVRRMVTADQVPVIVHGGGKAIKTLQEKFGVQPRYIGGLRVTDEQTILMVMMALGGQANMNLVAALTNAGVEAQGFTGADRGLLRSCPLIHSGGDLGRVGQIVAVRGALILETLAAKVVPVIAPVALAEDGGFHNVNADQAAGAIAAAIGAAQVTFLTDVPGVLQDGLRIDRLTRAQAQTLIGEGIARDGMAVKLNAALEALSAGVGQAMITNLDGLEHRIGTLVTV